MSAPTQSEAASESNDPHNQVTNSGSGRVIANGATSSEGKGNTTLTKTQEGLQEIAEKDTKTQIEDGNGVGKRKLLWKNNEKKEPEAATKMSATDNNRHFDPLSDPLQQTTDSSSVRKGNPMLTKTQEGQQESKEESV